MNKKILMVTEFSQLPTGYSVYSKEVLSRLHKVPGFEVAELACYCSEGDPKINNVPWKVFPNKPKNNTPEYESYKSYPTAEFGEFSFNSVLLTFQPDFVFDIRDFWMLSFEQNSPFRKFYNLALMPTVDAEPQNVEWVDTYSRADAIFTYSEFGRDTLKNQGVFNNFIDIAPPCASNAFYPIKDKGLLRNSFGLGTEPYIIGTVMRNQRRKLYPDLFYSFRQFLNKSGREDVFLYCHTSFPDVGWDIPALLMEHGLTNKALFTYKCSKCSDITCSFFSDIVKHCNKCNNFTSGICGINNPLSEQELAKVYNIFDIYIQYANSEGFGIPQIEASQCGNVVCSLDYSAMNSVIKNIGAIPIPVKQFALEPETGCKRAIPDNEKFIDILLELTKKTKEELNKMGRQMYINTLSNYNWNQTANKWIEYFKKCDIKNPNLTWRSPIVSPSPKPINNNLKSPIDQANFLVSEVLCKPELIGGFLWKRLLKELTYKATVENLNSFYLNENHSKDALRMKPFSYEDAYKQIVSLREYYNTWESHRAKCL